ncbi:hypothetical protein GINT2_000930 [Glugoides intestinalis]
MVNLKTPKGTVDLNPQQSITMDEIVKRVENIYKMHNGLPITTPTFELRGILTNKYGDDSKLIYNLEDQGGDICSLRYDLTVPFTRYLCTNRIQKMRRYQIANVFRRDNPSFKTGRLREFIQADFDICGSNLTMVNDAEILKMVYDILVSFELPHTFRIKINDRRILNSLLSLCQVPHELQQSACSTIDKFGKLPPQEMNNEFIMKGLSAYSVEKINALILKRRGNNQETIQFLEKLDSEELQAALCEISTLFSYLDIYGVSNIEIDISLARGLDYYTGLIIEATYDDVDVGSVIGGGRYDNLCKGLSEGSLQVPCVGFSVGISRVFSLFKLQSICSDVFVGSGFGLNLEDRMSILKILWKLGLRTETFSGKRVNYADQIEYAKKNNFKLAIFTGDDEIRSNKYVIVYLQTLQKVEVERERLEETLLPLFKL